MNTKGIKFLAVLAVLAMAFAACAVLTNAEQNDAEIKSTDVAKIGDKGYADLSTAFDEVTSGQTIEIIADCTLDDSSELKTGAKLLIPSGKVVTIASDKVLTVIGTIENNGKITVNVNNGLVLNGASAKITGPTDKTAIINGTANPLISAVNGTIENQTIKAPASYSETGKYVLESSSSTTSLTIQNNIFDLSAAKLIRGMAIANATTADAVINVLNNGVKGFVSEGVEKVRVLAIYSPGNNTTKFTFTGNGSAGVQYDTALLNLGGTTASPLNIVTAAPETGGFIMIDSSFVRLSVANPGLLFNSKVTVEELYIRANFGITENGDVTVTKKMFAATNVSVTHYDVAIAGKLTISQGASFLTGGEDVQDPLYMKGTTFDVTVTGSIVNNGTINNGAGSTFTGEGTITGTGVFENYGTLYVAKDNAHNVLCAVNLYGGSVWKYAADAYYANSTGGNTVIQMGATTTTKYVSAIQKNKSDGTIESATFDIYAPITLKNGEWLSGAEAQTVNVKSGASIGIGAVATTIYANDVLNFEEGAKFLGTAAVTVKKDATISYADSSQYYTNTTIEDGGKVFVVGEGGSTPEKVQPVDVGDKTTVDSSTFPDGVDVIIVDKAGLVDVTVPSGKAVVISGKPDATAVLDVSADNSEVTVNTGATAATYTVKTGGSNSIYLKDVTGSLSFKKGSVEIDISKWTGGEIQIDDGADVKIFGKAVADADLKIVMKDSTKKATLTIEKDAEVEITFSADKEFTVGAGITFTVDGKLTVKGDSTEHAGYADMTTEDKVTINGTVEVKGTYTSKKALNIYGTLKCGDVQAKENVIAYGASDINGAVFTMAAGKTYSGKDSNGGTWTIDGTKLTLTNYNGNYNFTQFKAGLQTIVLEGESKVTYSKKIDEIIGGTLFGAVGNPLTIKTVQGTGSLEVTVNNSKTAGGHLDDGLSVFIGSDVKLDTVGLKITVSGSNTDWTEDDIEAMVISAIEAATTFTMKDSTAVINVMGSYEAAGVIGIDATKTIVDPDPLVPPVIEYKPVAISGSSLVVVSAGAAIVGSTYTVTGSSVALNGQLYGVVANAAISFSNSVVEVAGKEAIVNLADGGVSFDGCSTVAVVGKEYAMAKSASIVDFVPVAIAGGVEIRNTVATFGGELFVSAIEITSGSNVKVEGELNATDVDLSQASELEVKDLVIMAAGSENNGTIIINDTATIIGSMTNKATLTNKGVMGIYGTFTNVDPGVFTNEGTLTVFNKELAAFAADKTFVLGADVRSDDTKAKLSSIILDSDATELSCNADGSVSIKGAVLTFDKDPLFNAKDLNKFDGYIMPSQEDDSYVLFLTNGTATVTVTYTYDNAKTATVGDRYVITVSGVLIDETDSTKVLYLESNKSDKSVNVTTDDFDDALWTLANSALVLTSGKTISTGIATLWSNYVGDAQVAAFNGKNSVFQGTLTSEIAAITLGGTFEGDLYARGTGLTTIGGKMLGDVIAKGNVLISGSIVGDVGIDLKAPLAAKLTVSGKMLGDLVYRSTYKATSTDTADTEAYAVMTIGADMSVATGETPVSFEINLAAATNATTTTAGTPGYFTFGTLQAPAAGKNVVIVLDQGMIKVPASVTIPERFQVVIEKDTTLEVVKGASLDVKKSALKVSKDAISHFETGSVSETYGLVACIMSFEIESGAYTIYSDVAYALTACDEGAELTVTTSADIADNVSVKKGVNVIIDDKVTLDFKTFGLEMDEGAKITLRGTGKVIFGQTGEDKTDDSDWKFFTVSGTIVYLDNTVTLADVRFDAAGAEFTGKAATSTEEAKISVKLNYSEGTVAVTGGIGTGTVTIGNTSYPLEKGAENTPVFGSFVIAIGAVFDATAINDAFSVVDYKKDAGDTVATIDKVVLKPTVVAVEGTLNLAASTTIKGVYAGLGVINLAAGKEFIFAKSDAVPGAAATGKTIPASVMVTIVDTTADKNGYALDLVTPVPGETIALKATSLKIAGENVDVMTISGVVKVGAITATTAAVVNGLTLKDDAALIGDEVYIIGASVADGFVYAKEIYMKEGAETSEFAVLTYVATFEDEGYTVYTNKFENIEFDEVDAVNLNANVTITEKLDLSGKDIQITIAEGKALTIKNVLIIGTPISILGDLTGSSITGKVIIDNSDVIGDNPRYYLVAYADVDLSDAEIVATHDNGAHKTDAVVSKLDVENIPYASIFAEDNTVVLAKADSKLTPEIVGYNFTAWLNYNGNAGAMVGDTNAYADAKAVLCTVMVKYVAGVDYYMDGVLFNVYDIPTDVPYGSYFTAKISDTSKYQGNPLINGLKTVCVDDDMILEASGVTPIPEPTPEPVVGDSGLSLTDILLIVLVVLIAIMVVILVLRLNRS